MKKCSFKVGDIVTSNGKYFDLPKDGKQYKVTAGPQEMCGTTVIWIEGKSACVAADGFEKV